MKRKLPSANGKLPANFFFKTKADQRPFSNSTGEDTLVGFFILSGGIYLPCRRETPSPILLINLDYHKGQPKALRLPILLLPINISEIGVGYDEGYCDNTISSPQMLILMFLRQHTLIRRPQVDLEPNG